MRPEAGSQRIQSTGPQFNPAGGLEQFERGEHARAGSESFQSDEAAGSTEH